MSAVIYDEVNQVKGKGIGGTVELILFIMEDTYKNSPKNLDTGKGRS
jgi:hypothetical protein